jgi:hypothetical protein
MWQFGAGGAGICRLVGGRFIHKGTAADFLCNGFHGERRDAVSDASPSGTVAFNELKLLHDGGPLERPVLLSYPLPTDAPLSTSGRWTTKPAPVPGPPPQFRPREGDGRTAGAAPALAAMRLRLVNMPISLNLPATSRCGSFGLTSKIDVNRFLSAYSY